MFLMFLTFLMAFPEIKLSSSAGDHPRSWRVLLRPDTAASAGVKLALFQKPHYYNLGGIDNAVIDRGVSIFPDL